MDERKPELSLGAAERRGEFRRGELPRRGVYPALRRRATPALPSAPSPSPPKGLEPLRCASALAFVAAIISS